MGGKETGGAETVAALKRQSAIGIRIHLDRDYHRARMRALREADNVGAAAGLLSRVVRVLRIVRGTPGLVTRVAMLVVTEVKVIVSELMNRAHMYMEVAHSDEPETGQHRQRNYGDRLRAPAGLGPWPKNHRS